MWERRSAAKPPAADRTFPLSQAMRPVPKRSTGPP